MTKRRKHKRRSTRRGHRSIKRRASSTARRRRRHQDSARRAVAPRRRRKRASTPRREVIRGEGMGHALRLEYRDVRGQRRFHNFPPRTVLGHVGRKFLVIRAPVQEFVV